jgi:hypothetical protein
MFDDTNSHEACMAAPHQYDEGESEWEIDEDGLFGALEESDGAGEDREECAIDEDKLLEALEESDGEGSKVATDTVDNTVAPGSRLRSPANKRPRLSFKCPSPINPEVNQLNSESDTPEFVEVRTVGTQSSFPERVVMCVVCGEHEVTWVLVPCGHRCVCPTCFINSGRHACTPETVKEKGFKVPFHKDCKCPLCRTVVREVVTLHQ